MDKKMAKENLPFKMALYKMEILRTGFLVAKERLFIQMANYTRVNLKMERNMVKV